MIADLQRNLSARGYPLAVDGQGGPVTFTALFAYMAPWPLGDRAVQLGHGLADQWQATGLTTPLRLAHWMAQTAVESGDYRFMREIWGPTDCQRGYEGRTDLGNTHPGDGKRFMGRGLLQITGRDLYRRIGAALGLDLVNHPELAERPDIAVRTACHYWTTHHLNDWADKDDVLAVSRGVNRGNPQSIKMPNGFPARQAALAKARKVLP